MLGTDLSSPAPAVRDGLLTVHQTTEPSRVRIALAGELDLANVGTAETALFEALRTRKDVLIDLRELEFLDSTGLALLMAAMRQLGEKLSFLPSESLEVRRLLGITGLDERMRFAA
jgi:anti-anti-sigma factor